MLIILVVASVLEFGPEMMKQRDVLHDLHCHSKAQFCQQTTTKFPYFSIPKLLLLVPKGNSVSVSLEYRRNEVNNHKPY